jgi:hypothetical protein
LTVSASGRFLIIIAACLISTFAKGQANSSATRLKTAVIVDTAFKADFSFIKENAETITTSANSTGLPAVDANNIFKPAGYDPAHPFANARCITDHRGIHTLRYCSASLSNDTLILELTGNNPAYPGKMTLKVYAKVFESTYHYIPQEPSAEKSSFSTIIQQLIIDKPVYKTGDTLSGRVKIIFEEDRSKTGEQEDINTYYLVGPFRTVIQAAALKEK